MHKGRTFVSQSISFPPGLLNQAKERAAKLGLPFSSYVQKCLERDLVERRALIIEERPDPSAAPASATARGRAKRDAAGSSRR